MDKITVVFVDDQIRFRKAIIEDLCRFGIQIVGEASNGQECLDILAKLRPDVVLLDLEMPRMDGNKTFNLIKENYPLTKVIILSQYDEQGIMENYIHRGVHGYIPKNFIMDDVAHLVEGIRVVKNTGKFFYSYDASNPLKYTKRETEVIPLLCDCRTSKEIGNQLGLKEKQINKLRQKLHQKTKSRNSTEFVKYCIENGLKFIGKK